MVYKKTLHSLKKKTLHTYMGGYTLRLCVAKALHAFFFYNNNRYNTKEQVGK